jgi:ComF family protein
MSRMNGGCLICGRSARRAELAHPTGLCADCRARIPWITAPQCRYCGRAIPCADCLRRPRRHVLMNRAAVQYTAEMKAWLARYKYRGDERLAPLFGWMLEHAYALLAEALQPLGIVPHAVAYVPLSPVRLKARSFNQAEQMALLLGRRLRLPVLPLLRRTGHTGKQSFKSRAERLHNPVGAITAAPEAAFLLKPGMRLLLVDDVYTTGATMHECARVLRACRPVDVFGLTWAR